MKKNGTKTISVKYRMANRNWEFRTPTNPPLFTKPIAVIILDEDDFVWEHQDIFKLIEAYHKADKEAIALIKAGKSGSVKTFEIPLLDKLEILIKDLRDADKPIQDGKFLKNGQKALRT